MGAGVDAWGCAGAGVGVDAWVCVGVTAGACVAVGTGLPAELGPVLEPERIVTGTAWPVTELDPCVVARAGTLARA